MNEEFIPPAEEESPVRRTVGQLQMVSASLGYLETAYTKQLKSVAMNDLPEADFAAIRKDWVENTQAVNRTNLAPEASIAWQIAYAELLLRADAVEEAGDMLLEAIDEAELLHNDELADKLRSILNGD